jgi:hypothetical protein
MCEEDITKEGEDGQLPDQLRLLQTEKHQKIKNGHGTRWQKIIIMADQRE